MRLCAENTLSPFLEAGPLEDLEARCVLISLQSIVLSLKKGPWNAPQSVQDSLLHVTCVTHSQLFLTEAWPHLL
jgi:hypothetical protein